jgi:hypothetical protein
MLAGLFDWLMLNHLGFIVLGILAWRGWPQDWLSAGIVFAGAALLALNWHGYTKPWINPPSAGRRIADEAYRLTPTEEQTPRLLPYWALAFATMIGSLATMIEPAFGQLYTLQELGLTTGGSLLLWAGLVGFFTGYSSLSVLVMLGIALLWLTEPLNTPLLAILISAQMGLLVLLWMLAFWFFRRLRQHAPKEQAS